VFDEHARYVWRTLRHLGVAEQDLDDASQEVFVVVLRRLSDFEGRSALRTWIYGICTRVASEHRRSTRRRREDPTPSPPVRSAPAHQVEDVERARAQERLLAVLDELDDDRRAVFVLYEIERLQMSEVAEAIGCPVQTAYSRLHSARRQLIAAYDAAAPVRRSA
jgi:RNA polymerase sigma-70 factor (ECF subfamily)